MAEEAEVGRASIRNLLKQKEELLKKNYKRDSFRLQGAGKKLITLLIEEELIKFIIEYRYQQISINSQEMIIKAKSLTNALDGKSYSSLMEWCYKLIKRAGFSIRKPTHVDQALKENTF